jgi:flagellar hook-basal body complex protein FliE
MPIDPTIAVGGGVDVAGPEWQIGLQDGTDTTAIDGVTGAPSTGSGSFGSMLADQIDQLSSLQADAATASRSLADGTAGDPESVVMAIERARLAMQLASQIRTKAVDAAQDLFHTQV